VTQEWDFHDPELAFAEIGIQLMLSQSLKQNSEVIFMLFHALPYWSNSGMKTKFMRYMKCVGAFINPNDMRRYS
jgi:hypothetical protein